jgi:hypothetical protein
MQALKKLIVANDNVNDIETSQPRLQDSSLRFQRVPAPQQRGKIYTRRLNRHPKSINMHGESCLSPRN